jgi:hypothetical protein
MGIGEFFDYETRIKNAVDGALDKNLQKLPGIIDDGLDKAEDRTQKLLDESQGRIRQELNDGLKKLEDHGNAFLDGAQHRLRTATDAFFTDLEQRWEKRLELETRAQFKLLNRMLVYTLAVAVISLIYALAKTKWGL